MMLGKMCTSKNTLPTHDPLDVTRVRSGQKELSTYPENTEHLGQRRFDVSGIQVLQKLSGNHDVIALVRHRNRSRKSMDGRRIYSRRQPVQPIPDRIQTCDRQSAVQILEDSSTPARVASDIEDILRTVWDVTEELPVPLLREWVGFTDGLVGVESFVTIHDSFPIIGSRTCTVLDHAFDRACEVILTLSKSTRRVANVIRARPSPSGVR